MTTADALASTKGDTLYSSQDLLPYFYEGPSSHRYSTDDADSEPRRFMLTNPRTGKTFSIGSYELADYFLSYREALAYRISCAEPDLEHLKSLMARLVLSEAGIVQPTAPETGA